MPTEVVATILVLGLLLGLAFATIRVVREYERVVAFRLGRLRKPLVEELIPPDIGGYVALENDLPRTLVLTVARGQGSDFGKILLTAVVRPADPLPLACAHQQHGAHAVHLSCVVDACLPRVTE